MTIIDLVLTNWNILLSFFFIALLYASVGFGGGSSYLAILALTSLTFTEIRATALICNIVVVSNSTILYYKNGFYNFKKVIPLVIASIPLAFLGGYLHIEERIFFLLLGCTLLAAGILMLVRKASTTSENIKQTSFLKSFGFGGSIGFISGLVGIGGGIFLAPLLHLSKWDNSKKIAATTSLFILVNSMSGLAGQVTNPEFHISLPFTLLLILITLIGGQIGSRIGIHIIKPNTLKKGTAVLIIFVAVKILWNSIK